MNTPSHLIVNLALFNHRGKQYIMPVALGALVPDLPIAVLFLIERYILKTPWPIVTSQRYYAPHWQDFVDIFNSIPLILIGLAIVSFFNAPKWKLFFLSMMAHVTLDIPVHTQDAHRHLFPFSEYRLNSQVSYWNPAEHAYIAALVELILVLVATAHLLRHITNRSARAALIGLNGIYVLGYLAIFMSYW